MIRMHDRRDAQVPSTNVKTRKPHHVPMHTQSNSSIIEFTTIMMSRIARVGGIHASVVLLVLFVVLVVNGYSPSPAVTVRLQLWPRPTLLVDPTPPSGASHMATTTTTNRNRRTSLRMGGYEFYAGPEYATETIPKKHTLFGIPCVEESFVLGPSTSRTSISNLVPIKEEGMSNTHALVQYLVENQIDLQGKSILEVGTSGISTVAATFFGPSSLTVAHFDPQRLHIWEHGYWFLNKPTACPVETSES